MIKAVIFDLFGVLTNDGLDEFALKHFGNDPDKMKRSDEIIDQQGAGAMTYPEMAAQLADMAGVDKAEIDAFMHAHRPNSRLLDYIRTELKGKYKLGVLSNSGADWFYEIFNKDDQELFDDVVLSYKVGLIKPQPEIYQLSLKNLGVEATQAVFVDDIGQYCQAAAKLGIHAINYIDFDQAKAEIEAILVADADN